MIEFLPKDVRDGLLSAHKSDLARKSRIRVRMDDQIVPVLKMWSTGFALDAEGAPHLRGFVDIFDGARHISQCLIVASSEDDGLVSYEFKRNTRASDRAAQDYASDDEAPAGFLERPDV